MALPNDIHPFQLLGNDGNQFKVANSLRFRSSASAYLSRTPSSSSSDPRTWTCSFWIKRGTLGTVQAPISSGSSAASSPYETQLYFDTDNLLYFKWNGNGVAGDNWVSSMVFRDPSAWYHIVLKADIANATRASRLLLYVNGVQQTFTPNGSNGNSATTAWENSSYPMSIAKSAYASSNYVDGYMAEFIFIDGQALTPSSFGQTDSLTNQWVPKKYTGTYGTNGFYLPFNTPVTSTYAGSFNGSNQYLQATLPATLSGAFTIEYFFNRGSSGNQFMFTLGDSANATGIEIYIGSTGTVLNALWGGSSKITATGSTSVIPVSSWNHIALTRDASNNVRLFLNGMQVGSTVANTNAIDTALRIGVEYFSSSISGYMNGSISNFRVINGTCLYTSNYNVPAAALTAVSGTSVLTLQSATVIDNSGNSLSITNNGTVTTSAATPWTNFIAGQDSSGSGNMWTSSGVSYTSGVTYDSMIDSPTNYNDGGNGRGNYLTINPLVTRSYWTVSNGNLTWTNASGAADQYAIDGWASITSQYYEFTATTVAASSVYIYAGDNNSYYCSNGQIYAGGSLATTVATFTSGDVLSFAVTSGVSTKIYKNGSLLYTSSYGSCYPLLNGYGGTVWNLNFGQRPFAYPSLSVGYKTLNTYNLPNPSLPLV